MKNILIFPRFTFLILFFLTVISSSRGQSRDTFPSQQEILQMKVDLYDAGAYLEKSSGGLTIGAILSVLGLGTMVYGVVNGEKNIIYGGAGVNVIGIIVMATTGGQLSKAGAALRKTGAPKKPVKQ